MPGAWAETERARKRSFSLGTSISAKAAADSALGPVRRSMFRNDLADHQHGLPCRGKASVNHELKYRFGHFGCRRAALQGAVGMQADLGFAFQSHSRRQTD